jgi:hypothetical protein|tara:strand:+ start:220 stop:762 length:543 start_codon:yes stop_codon:yes gene_type:complete
MIKFFIIVYLLLCKSSLGNEVLFEDFNNNPQDQWEFISDQVMGGESYGTVEFINQKNKLFARMTGSVSLENNGGFIQFRKKLKKSFDKNSKGIKIVARGNTEQYFIHIRTKGTLLPWQYYQAAFSVNSNWQSITIPIESFKRSSIMLSKNIIPSNIKSIAIVAYGKEYLALIDVSKVSIY